MLFCRTTLKDRRGITCDFITILFSEALRLVCAGKVHLCSSLMLFSTSLLVYIFFFFTFTVSCRTVLAGGGWVVRWCWVNFECRGVLLIWLIVGEGLAVIADGVVLTFFLSSIFSLLFLPLSGRRPDID